MNTQTISIDFPNNILLALNETEHELKQRVKIVLAVQLYKLQKHNEAIHLSRNQLEKR